MCQQAAPELLHLNDDDEPAIDVAEIGGASQVDCAAGGLRLRR